MSPDEHSICVRVLVHRSLQATGQVFLECGVFNDGNAEGIEESKHTLSFAAGNTLDLLNVVDLEASVGALLPLHQQSHQNRPLRVGMDAAASSLLEGCEEQWGTGGGVELEGLADVVAVRGRILGGGPFEDENVVRLDQFLLDPGRGNVDVIALTDRSLLFNQRGTVAMDRSKLTPPPVPVTHPQL